MNESDLDDSIVVDIITWVLYIGWLSMLSGFALYMEIKPLPAIVKAFPVQWQGQLAAVAVGTLFILASRMIFDRIKAGYAEKADKTDP